jgi:hypothetical protein
LFAKAYISTWLLARIENKNNIKDIKKKQKEIAETKIDV